jgi:hypothetical protein
MAMDNYSLKMEVIIEETSMAMRFMDMDSTNGTI